MRALKTVVAVLGILLSVPAWGQATARPCVADEQPGVACLLGHQSLAGLPATAIFWHLDSYASRAQAERAATATSTVVEAFGSIWLFTIEAQAWQAQGATHVATIGPLPVEPAESYSAEYLRSVFSPGMTAPLHTHSGPEAFFAVSGDTCLETPEGVKIGRGDGNSLLIRGGPPMLLMAVGRVPRRGFALILHDSRRPPTTLTQQWQPAGECARVFAADQVK